MLFQAPPLDARELAVLADVEGLRESLRHQLTEPRRWSGSLRRLSFARNLRASNSIEGFDAALDDAAAVAAGDDPMDADAETRLALAGYRDAMTYILQLAQEPEQEFEHSVALVKSLHFMMTSYSLANRPGRWRAGPVFVHSERSGETVHEGAPLELVPVLMADLVADLQAPDPRRPLIVQAGMAHLNLAMIHPFRDGNGRMARGLHSLALSRGGVLSPEFVSIEEYLGRNTDAYYDVLAQVGGGSWQPDRDARPWVRFLLTAHLRQARTLQRRVSESDRLWGVLEQMATQEGLPPRVIVALFDAALGLRVRRATYRSFLGPDEVTEQAASRDLANLVNRGLLVPRGEKRGRHYVGSPQVVEASQAIVRRRRSPDDTDPFGE